MVIVSTGNVFSKIVLYVTVWATPGLCARCPDEMQVTWVDFPPYVFRETDLEGSNSPTVIGAIHQLAEDMTRQCCGTKIALNMGNQVQRATQLEEAMRGAGLAYPVTRRSQHRGLDELIHTWYFLPVVELPGSFIVKLPVKEDTVIQDAISGSWPLALLVISAAGVAGFLVWFLDKSRNKDEFPESFLHGGWEGMWWAVVTATTVGYGDRAPRSIPARIFGLAWMFLGIILMSVFTATLVSAIQAEDKLGTDIKGTQVSVMNGSQEERYCFTAGAVPVVFGSLDEVLDSLTSGVVEAAMLDAFYTLYFSDKLHAREIQIAAVEPHTGVQGIVVANMSADVVECFARHVATKHYTAFDFMFEKVGQIKSMRGAAAHHTSRRLVGSNMVVIYVFCSLFSLLFLGFCSWEFIWFRPRERRRAMKEKSKNLQDKERLLEKNETHSL